MVAATPLPDTDVAALRRLGGVVRARRQELGLSQSELAARADLSLRFVVQVEGGSGNIAYARLRHLASALELSPADLIERAESERGRPIALLGLRGAGKSTVGRLLAESMGVRFYELDELIEDEVGLPLAQIFELQGERYFRRVERQVLGRLLESVDGGVIATGGGIVTDPETFALLKRRAITVWLKASPEEHWRRVVAQGDRRPMAGRPEAMGELERLWAARAGLYGGAAMAVETGGRSAEEVAGAVREGVGR